MLLDGFGRVPELLQAAVDGLTADELNHRVGGRSNSIAWLVWHLARVEDASIAEVFGSEPAWTAAGWYDRFGLPVEASDTGYGHDSEAVDTVRVDSAELLTGYYAAVHERTLEHLRFLGGEDLDRVVDEAYDPPVTLAVRLVSVLEDVLQHVGQAAFARGLMTERTSHG